MSQVKQEPKSRLRRQRYAALFLLYALVAVLGAWCGIVEGPGPPKFDPNFVALTELLWAIPMGLGFVWYCTVDAKAADKPLVEWAKFAVFLGWPVTVPIYLLWTHRLWGLVRLLLHGWLFILVLAWSVLITGCLVYGIEFVISDDIIKYWPGQTEPFLWG